MQGTDIGTILLLLCITLTTTVNDYLLHVVEEMDGLEIQNHITIAGTPLLFFYHSCHTQAQPSYYLTN